MYSQATIIGNLTKDITLTYIPSGTAVAKCSIAYTDGFGDKKTSHFIDVTVWGKTAEAFNSYCHKGSKVLLVGFLSFEQWNDKEGNPRSRHYLRVETMKMLDSKQDAQQKPQSQYNQQPPIEYDIDESEIAF